MSACLLLSAVVLLVNEPCLAQRRGPGRAPEMPAGDELKEAIVDSVCWILNKTYVYEDAAEEMEAALRGKLDAGDFDEFNTLAPFTQRLTEDLREVSGDLHLRVFAVGPLRMRELLEADESPDARRRRILETGRPRNFEFTKLEILDGNVGYMKLDGFVDAPYSGPTAAAAMSFLAHTDALIVDLRDNGGGYPSLVQLLMGYLLEEPTSLSSTYVRESDSLQQCWSAPHVRGPEMAHVDLFVLTSESTFSAAEHFTYDAQSMGRATVVGENTAGGAHPEELHLFPSLNVAAQVPYGRAISPVTGGNWEGTGVAPDIAVLADEAPDAAHLAALVKLREGASDTMWAAMLDLATERVLTGLDPIVVDAVMSASYAGENGRPY